MKNFTSVVSTVETAIKALAADDVARDGRKRESERVIVRASVCEREKERESE